MTTGDGRQNHNGPCPGSEQIPNRGGWPRGYCPECGGIYQIRSDGRLRRHGIPTSKRSSHQHYARKAIR